MIFNSGLHVLKRFATKSSDAANAQDTNDDPLNFKGFAPKLPLLLERPSAYMSRIVDSTDMLMSVEDGQPYERAIISPVITLPFLSLRGDERFSDDTIRYPFLHIPINHAFEQGTDVDEYFLTMYVAYVKAGLIYETKDGDLYTYGVADDDNFTIDDDVWAAGQTWAKANKQALSDLNVARLVKFSESDDEERELASSLIRDNWNITDDWNALLDKGRQASALLESSYSEITEEAFKPFEED